MPVWMLVQDGESAQYDFLGKEVKSAFFVARRELPTEPIALLVDSYGGMARHAYQIAMLLRRCCRSFTAIVPRKAKSGATLLTLGADRLLLGTHAELGSLDAQIVDPEREDVASALDEVQALERLYAASFEAVDQLMFLLVQRTRKRTETLLPFAMKFISDVTRPLFERIDTVHYTQQSRVLKVGEEYAIRLLRPRYGQAGAENIARALVHNYPEHPFVIDREEATAIGLGVAESPPALAEAIDRLCDALDDVTAIGKLQEVQNGEEAAA